MLIRFCRITLSVILALILAFPPAIHTHAASSGDPDVLDVNIGICPSAYQNLIASQGAEPSFSIQISVDNGSPFGGELKLRGAASKAMGLATQEKRLPLQLKPAQADLFARTLDNSCIKIINAYTPFRLFGEYLALEMYSFLQVPAPAHALMFLRFNSVDFGLFLASEDINADFLKKIDPDGGGSLFKSDYALKSGEHFVSSWFGALKMIEDHGSQRLASLTEALDRGTGYEVLLDVDEILRYFACLAAWGADSTLLTEQNNFFLYDTGKKFILIPWDNSEAFAAYPSGNGIDRYRMEQWEEDYEPPLFTLLMKNTAYKEAYHSYIRQINDGFLAPSQIDPCFAALASAAKPYLERDCTIFFNSPYELPVVPATGYGTAAALLGVLHQIHSNLQEQLNGKTDVFYANPVYDTLPNQAHDPNSTIDFLVQNSPTIDPTVTKKICSNYSTWCREVGKIPFDEGNPLELITTAVIFCAGFLILTRKKRRIKKTN